MLSDELYKWSAKGLFLKYLNKFESMKNMAKVPKGICRSHILGPKMIWLIYRHGYYWLTVVAN